MIVNRIRERASGQGQDGLPGESATDPAGPGQGGVQGHTRGREAEGFRYIDKIEAKKEAEEISPLYKEGREKEK